MFTRKRILGALVTLCLFHCEAEGEVEPTKQHDFYEVSNCLMRTSIAQETLSQLLQAVASDQELAELIGMGEENNTDALGKVVLILEDRSNQLADMVVSISTENDWGEERLRFRLQTATAVLEGQLSSRMNAALESKDPIQHLELITELLAEALSCNSEIIGSS